MLYKIHRLILILIVLISPARFAIALVAFAPIQAQAASTAHYQIELNTHMASAISIPKTATPDFDTEVMAPLHAVQAAQAKAQADAEAAAAAAAAQFAEAAKQAAATAAAKTVEVVAPVGDDAFAQLRYCEAGGDYTRNSGNGYYGAYQYAISSWGNYGGFTRPDLAPAAVQDAKAHADASARGFGAWPACARKLGLL